MIGRGSSLTYLADFVNGYAFTGTDLDGSATPVVRIQQLLDRDAEVDRTDLHVPKVAIDTGDLVFSWSATLATRIWDRGPSYLNQHLFRVDPRPGVDKRWLKYAIDVACDYLVGRMHGSAMTHVTRDMLRSVRLDVPQLAEQRAIADYLDAETAGIDALIAKKQQLIHLLEERRWRTFDELAATSSPELVPLRRVLTFLTDGPFGSAFSSADYVDSGMAVIRLGNIGFAEFRGDELAYLPLDRQPEFKRYRVRHGDLLAAALGDERNHAGRACVAPDLGAAIVKGKCFCGRVDARAADADYVALACSSPSAAERFRLGAQGSTRQMINLEIFKSLRIPLPPLDQQRRVVDEVRRAWQTLDEAMAALSRQIDLLAEHRQALVTAAVAGRLALLEPDGSRS